VQRHVPNRCNPFEENALMPGALHGIRIVDLTNIILGPYGTMLIADQGAEIIKVEAPEGMRSAISARRARRGAWARPSFT
jgi:crotonobetainyl-CoA:carnitine CoA-transferase CaiB-like acyl-CoA transferase